MKPFNKIDQKQKYFKIATKDDAENDTTREYKDKDRSKGVRGKTPNGMIQSSLLGNAFSIGEDYFFCAGRSNRNERDLMYESIDEVVEIHEEVSIRAHRFTIFSQNELGLYDLISVSLF